jgi:thiol-disulfide isomerase/thioredoxin
MYGRSFLIAALAVLCCLSISVPPAVEANATPEEGQVFPNLHLPLPQRVEERNYLKVENGPFTLSQVRSKIIIVEIFSMYCPHCQREAPNVNRLYEAIQADPKMASKIRLIGIGAGNSIFEVDAFRNLYHIEFPLIPDPNLVVHKKLGGVGTPYFFVLKHGPGGTLKVLYSRVGTFGEPQDFLKLIASRAEGQK